MSKNWDPSVKREAADVFEDRGASTPLPSFHLYNITRRVYLFLLLLIVLLVFIHFLEHKTRVWSCYVHGGKIARMYHRVNLLVHSTCHVDVIRK